MISRRSERRDHGKLAVERIDALFEFVFVLQTRIEPLQIRTVPERIGLLRNRNPAGYIVLHQERISDQLQYASPASLGFSRARQFPHKGFDDFEYFRHLAFVMGEHNALGENVGNDEQPFQ